jgi:hypothetical protein
MFIPAAATRNELSVAVRKEFSSSSELGSPAKNDVAPSHCSNHTRREKRCMLTRTVLSVYKSISCPFRPAIVKIRLEARVSVAGSRS